MNQKVVSIIIYIGKADPNAPKETLRAQPLEHFGKMTKERKS